MKKGYYRKSYDERYEAVAAGNLVWYTDLFNVGTGTGRIYRTKTHAIACASVNQYINMYESLHRALRRAATTPPHPDT